MAYFQPFFYSNSKKWSIEGICFIQYIYYKNLAATAESKHKKNLWWAKKNNFGENRIYFAQSIFLP
jgi:hypothetical protein